MKKLFLYPCILALLLFLTVSVSAQNASQKKQYATAKKFVTAYSEQNYKAMKKTLGGIARIVLSQKLLKESFDELFHLMGKARLDSIHYVSEKKIKAALIYDKDTTERQFLNFTMNKRNKIIGVWLSSPDFAYPKVNDTIIIHHLTEEEKSRKIDEIVNWKYSHGKFNGCVLAIDSGKVIYEKCYGDADFENILKAVRF